MLVAYKRRKEDVKMTGGVLMREVQYIKPSITNLKGRRGRKAIEELLNAKPKSRESLRLEAEKCKQNILALRRNGE